MPTIDGCTFVDNGASERGGAIYNNLCTPTITACEFTDNRSEGSGGAMFFAFYASPTLQGCTFTRNTAENNGGGFASDGLNFAAISLADCTFDSNGAMDGGAFWTSYSNPNFTNCNFIENFAQRGGAGFITFYSDPGMNGCDFSGDTSVSGAGTMQSSPDSLTTLVLVRTSIDAAASSHRACSFSTRPAPTTSPEIRTSPASPAGPTLSAAAWWMRRTSGW